MARSVLLTGNRMEYHADQSHHCCTLQTENSEITKQDNLYFYILCTAQFLNLLLKLLNDKE